MTKRLAIAFLLALLLLVGLGLLFSLRPPPPQPDERGPPEVSGPPASNEPARAASDREPAPPSAATAPADAPPGGGGPWSLSGRVLRLDATTPGTVSPVPDATVRLAVLENEYGRVDRNREERETSTGDDGRFELDGVPAETWQRLTIDAPSSALVVTNLMLPFVREARRDLGDFLLEPQASLLVRLVGPRDETIDGATVEARSTRHPGARGPSWGGILSFGGIREAEGLGRGEYLFNRLPPGGTAVSARAPGYNCALLEEVLWVAVDLPREEPLLLQLRDGHRIGGVVRDSDGAPVEGAEIEILAPGSDFLDSRASSRGGPTSRGSSSCATCRRGL